MEKGFKRTSSASRIYFGSESIHSLGASTRLSAYTSRLKVHGSSSAGRKVTLAVICRMIAWILDCMSAEDLSDTILNISQSVYQKTLLR